MAHQTIFQEPLIYSLIAKYLNSSELVKLCCANQEMKSMLPNITEGNFLLYNKKNNYLFLNFLRNLPNTITFPNIRSLDFSNNNQLSIEIIIDIFSRCPNLENIDISNISIFENDICIPINSILLYLAKNVPNLKRLNIWGCIISGFYLENLLNKSNQLEELYIIQTTINGRITDEFLDVLKVNCPNIKALCIERCLDITSKGLCKYLKENKNLTYLNVAGCYDLDDFVIFNIITYKKFKKLVITDGIFSKSAMMLLFQENKNIEVEIIDDDNSDMDDSEEDTEDAEDAEDAEN